MSRMGRSSSMSMGTLVLWIHVLVQRCRSRTYEFLQGGGWGARRAQDCFMITSQLSACSGPRQLPIFT